MELSLAYLIWIIPLLGLVQALLVLDNLKRFQKQYSQAERLIDSKDNKISILVPARNEEKNISKCIEALIAQNYENFEVLILNDCSEDRTLEIAQADSKNDTRFRVIDGLPKPKGWTGKNHACHQLYEAAHGEWLLFLDADTRIGQDALFQALNIALIEDASLLSFWPRQEMKTRPEKLMMPLLSFILLAFLPLRFAEWTKIPIFTAANGQFMLFRTDAYEKSGGHSKLADEIMDDVRLAQMIKQTAGKVIIRDAAANAICHMYESFPQIWVGFRKNLYPAFKGRVFVFLLSLAALALGHSLPLLIALIGIISHQEYLIIPMSIQLASGILIRLILAVRLKQSFLSAFFHPFSVSIVIALALESFRAYSGEGVSWKGRTYKGS